MTKQEIEDNLLEAAAKLNVGAIQTEVGAYQTLAGMLKSEMALEGRYET